MKFLSVGITLCLILSGVAIAAPTAPDLRNTAPSSSAPDVVVVDDDLLEAVEGGLNRAACIGVAIGLGLSALAAGALTGGVGWAVAGAYVPAVGAVLCSL